MKVNSFEGGLILGTVIYFTVDVLYDKVMEKKRKKFIRKVLYGNQNLEEEYNKFVVSTSEVPECFTCKKENLDRYTYTRLYNISRAVKEFQKRRV